MRREEYSAGVRNAQRYITFSSKAVLQGLCSQASYRVCWRRARQCFWESEKRENAGQKVIFLQNMELKLKHQNPFRKKYCNPFWTSWNCIVLVKAGPRCLAGEFGHGLSSLPEPQGQNQGALGWKSRRRLGIPRSSGRGIKRRRGRILKMGEIFFVFFQKVRSCTLYIIKAHHDDLAPIPPVLLQLWTTICNDYCNRIRLFSCL